MRNVSGKLFTLLALRFTEKHLDSTLYSCALVEYVALRIRFPPYSIIGKGANFGQTFLFNKPNYIESLCRWAEFWPLTIKAYFGRWFPSLKPLLCANILSIMEIFRYQEEIRVQKLFNFEDTVLTFCSFDTALYFCVVI